MSFLESFETVTGKKIDVKIKNNDSQPTMNEPSMNDSNSQKNIKTNTTDIVKKEGFIGLNKNYMNTGEVYASYPSNTLNTNNWMYPALVAGSPELNKLNSYKNTPLPLQNDNMFMFSHTEFKPDCCKYGETYSNSMGCACMNVDSAKYLWQRGGNNVPLIQGSSI